MMSEKEFNLVNFIKVMLKWKKTLLYVLLISISGSILTAFMLPVYFKSTTIIYPFNPKSYDPKFILMENPDFEIYGNNQDVERIIAMGKSSQIAYFMIDKYDLVKSYEIDTTNAYYKSHALEEFNKNYTIIKNELGGVEISFLDQDRNKAANIVNEITYQIDVINRKALSDDNKKMYTAFSSILKEKAKGLDSLNLSYT